MPDLMNFNEKYQKIVFLLGYKREFIHKTKNTIAKSSIL